MEGFFEWDYAEVQAARHEEIEWIPCPNCGATVNIERNIEAHVCERRRMLSHHEAIFEWEWKRFPYVQGSPDTAPVFSWSAFDTWSETPEGKFEAWLAENGRL